MYSVTSGKHLQVVQKESVTVSESENQQKATVTVRPNGSLRVNGAILIGADGEIITERESYSLCRCGHSQDKPFCDGSHRACDFVDEGVHTPVE